MIININNNINDTIMKLLRNDNDKICQLLFYAIMT